MACYHPIEVGILRKSITPNGSRIRDAQVVPCGHCLGCRADQARQWSIRIMHECQVQDSAWFLTLTYSEENLPENGSLNPSHLRAFFKSLRRQFPPGQVRYFACGEYGELSQRPHYHAVLFGVDFLDKCRVPRPSDSAVWRSPTLESYWTLGISEFGTVTPASAAYVAGYVRKKVARRDNPDAYVRVDADTGELVNVEPEFSRMSLRPAIGRKWLERYWKDVYPRDYVVMDGKEFKPPRYYDKWMDENHPEIMMKVREKRINEAEELSEYTLGAAERIHKARVGLFQQRGKI